MVVISGCTQPDKIEENASKIVDVSDTAHNFTPVVNQGTGTRKEMSDKAVEQKIKSVSKPEVAAVASQITPKEPKNHNNVQTLIKPLNGPLKPRYQYVPSKKKPDQNKEGIINESKAIPNGNELLHEERIKELEQRKKAIDKDYDIVVDENGKIVGVSNDPVVARDSNGDYFFHDPKEEFRRSENNTVSN